MTTQNKNYGWKAAAACIVATPLIAVTDLFGVLVLEGFLDTIKANAAKPTISIRSAQQAYNL